MTWSVEMVESTYGLNTVLINRIICYGNTRWLQSCADSYEGSLWVRCLNK